MSMKTADHRDVTTLAEKIVWILFCITCYQTVLLKSFVTVATGLKTDVYSSILCAVTLAACLITARKEAVRASLWEILVSLALLGLAAASGLKSSVPWSSSIWAFSMAAYCLGGFWCARILLATRFRQVFFVWACSSLLTILLGLSLWGYYFHGVSQYFVDDLHQLVNLVLILSFAPLTLMMDRRLIVKVMAGMTILAAYIALYVCGIGGVELGVLIPVAMLAPAFFISMARGGQRYALLFVLLIVVAVTAHYVTRISSENFAGESYQAERLEFYKFSFHAAKKHPLWGIGIRAPREEVLSDYKVWHPKLTHEQFATEAKRLVTSQNIFLTLMVGFGVPFALLYLIAVMVMYIRLLRSTWRPLSGQVVPPMALLIPVTGCLIHFLTMDIMLMPQIAWFFHVLLGMIPSASQRASREKVSEVRHFDFRGATRAAAATGGALVLGILVGTHPALAPARVPSLEQIRDYLYQVPLLSPVMKVWRPPATRCESRPGSLMVTLPTTDIEAPRWALLMLLDNSESMERHTEGWTPNRINAAVEFMETVASSMAAEEKLSVRSFRKIGPFQKGSRDFFPRVSRLVFEWREPSLSDLSIRLRQEFEPGPNNLCAGLQLSASRDFAMLDGTLSPRLAVITDASETCPFVEAVIQTKKELAKKLGLIIDVVTIGAEPSNKRRLAEAFDTEAVKIIDIDTPSRAAVAAREYASVLSAPTMRPLLVIGSDATYEVLPGQWLTLPSGKYTLRLPLLRGVRDTLQNSFEVDVSPGMSSAFAISVSRGAVSVVRRDEKDNEQP
jgi:hypothetical protein